MRIQQLEYLERIVEAGSINEAAKRLFLTQPSLSNAVKELENEMGIQIFQRSSGGISLGQLHQQADSFFVTASMFFHNLFNQFFSRCLC